MHGYLKTLAVGGQLAEIEDNKRDRMIRNANPNLTINHVIHRAMRQLATATFQPSVLGASYVSLGSRK